MVNEQQQQPGWRRVRDWGSNDEPEKKRHRGYHSSKENRPDKKGVGLSFKDMLDRAISRGEKGAGTTSTPQISVDGTLANDGACLQSPPLQRNMDGSETQDNNTLCELLMPRSPRQRGTGPVTQDSCIQAGDASGA